MMTYFFLRYYKNVKSNRNIAEYFLIKETTEKIITPRVCLLYELIKKSPFVFYFFMYIFHIIFDIKITAQQKN